MSRETAQAKWLDKLGECGYFEEVPVENVPTESAAGRITACSIYARRSVPHYNSAAMDGIAVWAADTFGASDRTPKQLKVLKAGQPFVPGSCYRVNTGNVLPLGTNAVIMVEQLHFHEDQVEILAPATPWQHVRIIGEDIVEKELILPEQEEVTPAAVGALLVAGLESVPVVAKPTVVIIPTGSELVATQKELAPGKILDVNSHMLAAAVTRSGGIALRKGIVPDEYQAIKKAITDSLAGCDMVLINAGTSAGTEDYTYQVLEELGEVLVHGVAIKPGKPVILAICNGKPVVGLPGYPVSTMLTYDLFVQPVLVRRGKMRDVPRDTVRANLARQLPSEVGVEEYLRVSLGFVQGRQVAVPLSRGAGLISSLTRAHGVLRVEQGSAGLQTGTSVEVDLLNKNVAEQETLLVIGSHDLALDVLGVYLRRKGGVLLSCANVGSMGGIMAVRNGEAHLAGVHILDEKTGKYNTCIGQYMAGKRWQLIHLAMREQGLMVKKGNPKQIYSIGDLNRKGIVMVNRQRGAGTRMLLDYKLKQLGIARQDLAGYEKEVGTHMAVAATIAAGAADVGLGIRAVAEIMNLDFIPVAQEQYDLVSTLEPDGKLVKLLISILQSCSFRKELEVLGGYNLDKAGTIIMQGGN